MTPETAAGRGGGRGVRLLPNAVTVLALCSGLSGVQFMLADNRVAALACIALAAIFDALDGRLARLLDRPLIVRLLDLAYTAFLRVRRLWRPAR